MLPKDLLQYANKVPQENIQKEILHTFKPAEEIAILPNGPTIAPIVMMNGDSLELSHVGDRLATLNAHRSFSVIETSFEQIHGISTCTVRFQYQK